MKNKSLMFILLLLFLTPLVVSADSKVSLKIEYNYDDVNIENAVFNFYKIADFDDDKKYNLTDKFSSYGLDIDDLTTDHSQSKVNAILSLIERDKIGKDFSYTTNKYGEILLKDFPFGLYLITSDKISLNNYTYTSVSYLLSFPYYEKEKGEWKYEIVSIPKIIREKDQKKQRYINKKVAIIWDDQNYSNRPSSVDVYLLKDGVIYDDVILSVDNNWRYIWKNLEVYDENGSKIVYSVVQTDINGYVVSITEDGSSFIIKNKYKKIKKSETDEEKLPNTGVLWWPIPILLVIGFIFVKVGINLGRKNEKRI